MYILFTIYHMRNTPENSESSGPEEVASFGQPIRVENEKYIPLQGNELVQARYKELSSMVKSSDEARTILRLQYQPLFDAGDNANDKQLKEERSKERVITIEATKDDEGSIHLKGHRPEFTAVIHPDGSIEGSIPERVMHFLQYNRCESDVVYRTIDHSGHTQENKKHETQVVNAHYRGGGSMSAIYEPSLQEQQQIQQIERGLQ